MMPEQHQLLDKAKTSIQGSNSLVRDGLYGFSISRSYYAMFYAAQALLLGKGLSFSKHSGVLAGFGLHFIKTGILPASLHRDIITAQEDRLKADYDIQSVHNAETANHWIERAEAFILQAEQYLQAHSDEQAQT